MSSDDLAERFARLEQRGKRFSELVAVKLAELRAADPTLDDAALKEKAEAAAGEQLAKERS